MSFKRTIRRITTKLIVDILRIICIVSTMTLKFNVKNAIQFVSNWTPESAWWWGILLGDGCVSLSKSGGRVSVCGSYSTVVKWLALIAPHKNPQEFKRSPGTFQGYIDCTELVCYFRDTYGICGKKSDKLKWPKNIPDSVKLFFIRGLFDSDGSLSIERRRHKKTHGNDVYIVSYSSNTETFVSQLNYEISTLACVTPSSIVKCTPKIGLPIFIIKWNSTAALKIAKLLYSDPVNHLVNEDRIKKFNEFLVLETLLSSPCGCGNSQTRQGLCQTCWWDKRGRVTGKGTVCPCGRSKILASGLCTACYSKKRRSDPAFIRKSTGLCTCGKPAYRKQKCDPCYAKLRRAELSLTKTEKMLNGTSN